jgi:regulator of RNase E activity RraA
MTDIVARLGAIPVPTLVSTLGKLGLRTRAFSGLRPLTEANASFAGPAFTVRTVPAREDQRDAVNAGKAPYLQRQAMAAVQSGQVMVIDAGGISDVAGAGGDIIALYLKMQGVKGVITDSGMGDAPNTIKVGLPVFCMGPVAAPGNFKIQVADWNVPIGCAGVAVYPGDIIVADATGAVCVPKEHAEEVADISEKAEEMEVFMIERIKAGAPLATTYPPDKATLEAYAAWKAANTSA